jgi:hypothetical protein
MAMNGEVHPEKADPRAGAQSRGPKRYIQRGSFAQVTWGPVTIGGFWFNPGSRDQVFVGSIGAEF